MLDPGSVIHQSLKHKSTTIAIQYTCTVGNQRVFKLDSELNNSIPKLTVSTTQEVAIERANCTSSKTIFSIQSI